MTTRDDVIAEAPTWLGTPFHEGAHLRGIGCDCIGLVGGVAVGAGLAPADFWETDFAPWHGYSQTAHEGSLIAGLDAFLDRIDPHDARAGDVIVIRWAGEPQHLAILVPYAHGGLAMVHALNAPAIQRVTEHRLGGAWLRRVSHAYRYRGLA